MVLGEAVIQTFSHPERSGRPQSPVVLIFSGTIGEFSLAPRATGRRTPFRVRRSTRR